MIFIMRFGEAEQSNLLTINNVGAKRLHYSMFDVGRSMFDVQYLQHVSVVRSE